MHSKNFQLSFKNHNFTDYLGFYALKETNMARKAQNKKKYTFESKLPREFQKYV